METIKASDCKTLEEYRAYQRQKSKLWYQKNREKKIDTEHFILTAYSKSLHIEYKNAETLKRFNLMAMKGSGMLPPDMDKKKYEDMNEEEKEIVKFFGFKPFEYDELNNSSCIKLLN